MSLISYIEGKTFSIFQQMQNSQLLTDCGIVNKYVWNYIQKIDENNDVIFIVDGKGWLVTDNFFSAIQNLKHQKWTSTKRKKTQYNSHVQVIGVIHMDMIHVALKYSEVINDYMGSILRK